MASGVPTVGLMPYFERDLRAKEQREDLVSLQHRVPELLDRIEAMKAGAPGRPGSCAR